MRSKIFRHLVAGVINTSFTYLIYLSLLNFVPRSIAYTVAFGLGVLISYFANRRFVFDVGGSGSRFIIFASVPLMQFALTLSLLELLVFCGVDQRISLGISILAIYPFVFLASRFVFEIIKLPKGREFTSRIRGAKKKGGGIIRS